MLEEHLVCLAEMRQPVVDARTCPVLRTAPKAEIHPLAVLALVRIRRLHAAEFVLPRRVEQVDQSVLQHIPQVHTRGGYRIGAILALPDDAGGECLVAPVRGPLASLGSAKDARLVQSEKRMIGLFLLVIGVDQEHAPHANLVEAAKPLAQAPR